MIRSMTPEERAHPDIIDASRRVRIAKGSGVSPAEVNSLLKQYWFMRDFMKQAGRGGLFSGRRNLAEAMAELSQVTQPGFKFPTRRRRRGRPRRRVEAVVQSRKKRSKRPKPKRRK